MNRDKYKKIKNIYLIYIAEKFFINILESNNWLKLFYLILFNFIKSFSLLNFQISYQSSRFLETLFVKFYKLIILWNINIIINIILKKTRKGRNPEHKCDVTIFLHKRINL